MVGVDSAIWTALIFDRDALWQCFGNREISCDFVPFAQEIFPVEIGNRICSENSFKKKTEQMTSCEIGAILSSLSYRIWDSVRYLESVQMPRNSVRALVVKSF